MSCSKKMICTGYQDIPSGIPVTILSVPTWDAYWMERDRDWRVYPVRWLDESGHIRYANVPGAKLIPGDSVAA